MCSGQILAKLFIHRGLYRIARAYHNRKAKNRVVLSTKGTSPFTKACSDGYVWLPLIANFSHFDCAHWYISSLSGSPLIIAAGTTMHNSSLRSRKRRPLATTRHVHVDSAAISMCLVGFRSVSMEPELGTRLLI